MEERKGGVGYQEVVLFAALIYFLLQQTIPSIGIGREQYPMRLHLLERYLLNYNPYYSGVTFTYNRGLADHIGPVQIHNVEAFGLRGRIVFLRAGGTFHSVDASQPYSVVNSFTTTEEMWRFHPEFRGTVMKTPEEHYDSVMRAIVSELEILDLMSKVLVAIAVVFASRSFLLSLITGLLGTIGLGLVPLLEWIRAERATGMQPTDFGLERLANKSCIMREMGTEFVCLIIIFGYIARELSKKRKGARWGAMVGAAFICAEATNLTIWAGERALLRLGTFLEIFLFDPDLAIRTKLDFVSAALAQGVIPLSALLLARWAFLSKSWFLDASSIATGLGVLGRVFRAPRLKG